MIYNIEIRKCSPKTCGEGYMELWINGVEIMVGDEYHNKISIAIDSFIEGLKFTTEPTQINLSKTEIKCKFGCD